MMMNKITAAAFLMFFAGIALGQNKSIHTFTNPLLPSGADPWVIHQNG